MRSCIARVLILPMVMAPLLLLAPAPVFADTECQVNDPQTGVCRSPTIHPMGPDESRRPQGDRAAVRARPLTRLAMAATGSTQ